MVTKILMPITNGLHHFFRLSCFNFALISPQMATNTKPNMKRIAIIIVIAISLCCYTDKGHHTQSKQNLLCRDILI